MALDTLLKSKEFILNDTNLMDVQVSGIDLHVVSDHAIICYSCARNSKTKGGYDRHLRKMHDVQNDNCGKYEIVDSDIANILNAAGSELGTDECYPVVIRNKWLEYKITPIHSLTSQIKTIYGKLVEMSNVEHFYQLFYSQLLYCPNFFTGLDNNLSVELLQKAADKFLAHYQKQVK